MLKAMTKSACALAAALTFVSTAAHAENLSVEINNGAYLPIISYIDLGDNLIFINETNMAHTINGSNGAWTSGSIAPGGSYVMNIDEQMALTFGGTNTKGQYMQGEYTYEPAPTDDGT